MQILVVYIIIHKVIAHSSLKFKESYHDKAHDHQIQQRPPPQPPTHLSLVGCYLSNISY